MLSAKYNVPLCELRFQVFSVILKHMHFYFTAGCRYFILLFCRKIGRIMYRKFNFTHIWMKKQAYQFSVILLQFQVIFKKKRKWKRKRN